MKIENPFESGHIRNYILAYVGVVVIMVLFFIAAQMWREPKEYPKKEFPTKQAQKMEPKTNKKSTPKEYSEPKSSIKLLPNGY